MDQAEQDLRAAIAALAEWEHTLAPHQPSETGIVPISSKEDLEAISSTDANAFYQLTQDLVLEGSYWIPSLAGVLDGNGHTIQAMQALCAYERFLNGESGYWDLKGISLDEAAADKVQQMSEKLPQNITLAEKAIADQTAAGQVDKRRFSACRMLLPWQI